MKSLVEFVNEAYERRFDIPPYEYEVIMKALRAYLDNKDRKKNQGNGEPTDKDLESVIKFMGEEGRFERNGYRPQLLRR
jgi:hypothetical protein